MRAIFLIIGTVYLVVAILMFRKVMPKGKNRWIEDSIVKVYSAINSKDPETLSLYLELEDEGSLKEILRNRSGRYIPRDFRISVFGDSATVTYRLEKREGKATIGQRWMISGLREVNGRWKVIWTGREIF